MSEVAQCKLWWFEEADIEEVISHECHECCLEVEHEGCCVCGQCKDELVDKLFEGTGL